jgi:hypothetical protein
MGKLTGMLSGAIGAVKGVFGIHSPSAVTRDEIGVPLGGGIVEGAVLGLQPLQKAVGGALLTALDSVTTAGRIEWASAGNSLGSSFNAGVIGSLQSLEGMMQSALTEALNKAWQAAWNAFLPQLQNLTAMVSAAASGLAPGVSASNVVPKLDSGGTIMRTGLAVVHRGETYSGVGAARRPLGGGGDTTIHVTVNGWVGNDQQIAARIRTELIRTGRRSGGNVLGGLA